MRVGGVSSPGSPGSLANPGGSVAPAPDYPDICAPAGTDTSSTCLRLTLAAIDAARADEHVRPMRLPSDLAQLSVPEQLFVAIDRERVDRGLTPFPGLSASLDHNAAKGADTAQLPPRPGHAYSSVDTEWIGDVANGLDADYQWMYDDGPDSGVPGCSGGQTSGCWGDRDIVLGRFGAKHLVIGAAFDPIGDTSKGDRGGSSLAATLAISSSAAGPYAYTWKEALAAMSAGTLQPLPRCPPRSPTPVSRTRLATLLRCPTTRGCAPATESTTPPGASTPSSAPSTTRTRSRGYGRWCCRRTSTA